MFKSFFAGLSRDIGEATGVNDHREHLKDRQAPPFWRLDLSSMGVRVSRSNTPSWLGVLKEFGVNLVPPLRSFLHLTLPFELAFEVSTRLYNCYLFLYFHHRSFILT